MNPLRTTLALAVLAIVSFVSPGSALADRSTLTITVTPPLYQITQTAGTEWRSQLRVVNSNDYDITVTVSPKDFHPDGETGNAVFEDGPRRDASDPEKMSGWISVPSESITLARGVTAEIPFSIRVPENADPGGHYGAIMVSTKPGELGNSSGAGVSSAVTSLIFLRVPGDVHEKGSIRDFYTEDSVIERPEARFVVRFENEGNVHLVPQGEIVISNMWGKVRGKVSINESSTFGNVLPGSTRKFEFLWKEIDASPLEVGRYRAVATIVYGTDERSTVERTVFFWIVPWKPVSAILITIFLFVWSIAFMLRRYVRRALDMERERLGMSREEFASHRSGAPGGEKRTATLKVLSRPLEFEPPRQNSGREDSPSRRGATTKKTHRSLRRYRPLISFFTVVAIGIGLISWYFVEVFQEERAYHVEQIRPK